MNVYEKNFMALAKIVDMDAVKTFSFEAAKSEAEGFMDLNLDYLHGNDVAAVIALSHYYRVNGDSVADPDMQLLVNFRDRTVRALAYQDAYTYQDVRTCPEGARRRLQASMDRFLATWLRNLYQQGHRIDAAAIERCKGSHRIAEEA